MLLCSDLPLPASDFKREAAWPLAGAARSKYPFQRLGSRMGSDVVFLKIQRVGPVKS